jgi:hypothetical protein
MLRFLPLIVLFSPLALIAQEMVRVYPAPEGETLSTRYKVAVSGKDAPVYTASISSLDPQARKTLNRPSPSTDTAFASFDMRGPARVTVTFPSGVKKAVVLPTSRGIHPMVAGNQITFTVSKPGPLVLEVNDDWLNSLQIFANPWEEDAPDPKDPNVIYYGPGVHEVEGVIVPSGKTVYIAGGAVVYGKSTEGEKNPIFFLKGDHITLRGRGIVDGSRCAYHTRNMIVVAGRDIKLEGVVLRDSSTWNVPVQGSDQVRIENIKIFGYRGNSDGIDINNSRDVDVGDCYLRTFDDLVVIKSSDLKRGKSSNITVHNCVLWNEFAHALSLGAELRLDVDGVRFTDCDVVRDKGREWVLRVYQCDSGHMKNIVFDNIRIEEGRRLMSAWIGRANWSRDEERGHIDNVIFKNIEANASSTIADLVGFDATHQVRDVKFDHVKVNGQPLRESDVRRNEFVEGVTVTP